MSDTNFLSFKCLEVEQPIGKFYIGTIEAQDLFEISFADVRRIEDRDLERIVGIQRPLVSARVDELKKYVTTVDATFPTSIILAIKAKDLKYDAKTQTMQVRQYRDVAKIIDGQHRIAGLENFDGKFQLNVTIFVDMDLEDQAMVFATINLKQTKVNKSLAYDLYEFATSRSPQKTCHNIAKLLNTKKGSPFEEKIKILGAAIGQSYETLTQATFVEGLLPYISDNAMKDRDLIKRGKEIERIESPDTQKFIFRNMFIDEQDAEIARIIYNYFGAVADKWHDAWYTKESGKILSRTTGFAALMKFLKDAYNSFEKPGKIVSLDEFKGIFAKIRLRESDFTPDKYNPGGIGERALYNDLLEHWQNQR